MTLSREERDIKHNAALPVYPVIKTASGQWVDWGPGIQMQVLRVSQETGYWSCLFKLAAGARFGRHEHLGAGESFMIHGKAHIRGGAENGGITVETGDYSYEANGAIHDETVIVEDSISYFANNGPLKFLDDDDNVTFICDWRAILDANLSSIEAKDPAGTA